MLNIFGEATKVSLQNFYQYWSNATTIIYSRLKIDPKSGDNIDFK